MRPHFPLALPILVLLAPIALAQPNIAPPAPKIVPAPLPKEPLIEPAARAAVEALAARYKAMKSYSDVTKLASFAGEFEAKIQWERPNRARVEAKLGGKTSFGLIDGISLWALNPKHPNYFLRRANANNRIFDALNEADTGGPGFMFMVDDDGEDAMKNLLRDGLTKLEMGLPEDFEGAPMQTVRATFAFDDGHDSLLTLFIGKNDGLLHQLTQNYSGKGNIVETHRDIKIDPVLPPETWAWTPPANLKPVEYFSQLEPNRFKPAFDVGQKLPDFKALDVDGKPLSLSALKGKSVVLFFFSIGNAGGIEQLMESQKQVGTEKLAIIGISMDGRRERVQEWVAKSKVSFPIAFDEAGSRNPIATTYGVRSWTTLLLVDETGVLRSISSGPYGPEYDAAIEALKP